MTRFLAGDMGGLVAEARTAPVPSRTQRDTQTEEAALLEAVCAKVRLGEVSRARQLMTSSGIAPGTAETLAELRDPDLRPPRLIAAIPEEVLSFRPARRLVLDRAKLARSVQSARRGSAADLSGTRPEHFKTLLDDEDVWDMFCDMSEAFVKAEAPEGIS